MKVRPEVRKFAKAMERIFRENDHKTGWEDMNSDELMEKFNEELREVNEALEDGHLGDLRREVTDVANICMMIWWNAENKEGFFE